MMMIIVMILIVIMVSIMLVLVEIGMAASFSVAQSVLWPMQGAEAVYCAAMVIMLYNDMMFAKSEKKS